MMKSQYLAKNKLPDKPGVYIFRDGKNRPLYIGRATSLCSRTKSYFSNDLIETRGPRIVDMVTKASKLTYEETDSVLEAIILESNLIKRYQPKYNIDEKDDKSDTYIIITKEVWPRVFTMRVRDLEKNGNLLKGNGKESDSKIKFEKFGPYFQGGLVNQALKILRKVFPFRDFKSKDSRHEQFYRSINRSPRSDSEESRLEYVSVIRNLKMFLRGRKKLLVKALKRDMSRMAKIREFEKANDIKKTIFALKHINDMALISRDESARSRPVNEQSGLELPQLRIEAYDIAHISGTNVVGSMVVSINGNFEKKEYRTFKISKDTNDDINNLKELVSRRLNHPEWNFPDLIVVDGNIAHKNAVEAILSSRRINIKVVAVTKDERHKARAILGDIDSIGGKTISKPEKSSLASEIVRLNAEAHRFTLKYHRRRRG
jgi:excinuclease ABC subunit C